jgi:hypothetical protein
LFCFVYSLVSLFPFFAFFLCIFFAFFSFVFYNLFLFSTIYRPLSKTKKRLFLPYEIGHYNYNCTYNLFLSYCVLIFSSTFFPPFSPFFPFFLFFPFLNFPFLIFSLRPDGRTFVVPPDNVHVSRIAVGDVVTFSYNHHSQRHIPANPTVFKIRTDISWEDVVQLYFREQKYIKGTRREEMEGDREEEFPWEIYWHFHEPLDYSSFCETILCNFVVEKKHMNDPRKEEGEG